MKLFSTIALALSWDSGYGIFDNSLNNVACSNGEHGLESKGYTTYGSLPSFPYIASSNVVEGWNSVNCGTCWLLTYNDRNITVLTVDHADVGFFTSEAALNDLTYGQAAAGSVEANATQVDASACGL
ncbi:Cerato-platanin [Armillaria mellea]|nr:Cerato-platanin [Armillaria mellea]